MIQAISDLQDAPIGTLPWTSVTERPVAAGMSKSMLEIVPLGLTVVCRATKYTPVSRLGGFSTRRRIADTTAPNFAKISMLVRGWRVEICNERCA